MRLAAQIQDRMALHRAYARARRRWAWLPEALLRFAFTRGWIG